MNPGRPTPAVNTEHEPYLCWFNYGDSQLLLLGQPHSLCNLSNLKVESIQRLCHVSCEDNILEQMYFRAIYIYR